MVEVFTDIQKLMLQSLYYQDHINIYQYITTFSSPDKINNTTNSSIITRSLYNLFLMDMVEYRDGEKVNEYFTRFDPYRDIQLTKYGKEVMTTIIAPPNIMGKS